MAVVAINCFRLYRCSRGTKFSVIVTSLCRRIPQPTRFRSIDSVITFCEHPILRFGNARWELLAALCACHNDAAFRGVGLRPKLAKNHSRTLSAHFRERQYIMAASDAVHSRSKRNVWTRVDRWMRSIHLHTGLFLVPWMMVYATSALLINHGPAFHEWFDIQPPKQEVVRECEFTPSDSFPENLDQQAAAILAHLHLEGAHRILAAQSNPRQLKIFRMCARGNFIVTWNRLEKSIVVQQQQPFSYLRLITFLHFKGGYGQPYLAHILWAVVVDLVALSIAFWVVSGVYIWARRPTRRLLGGVVLAAGIALFITLVFALCS